MTQIEKIRKAKAQPGWLPWIWLAGAGLWFFAVLVNIVLAKAGLAVLTACCFAAFLFKHFETSQTRLNKELVAEIDRLKKGN